MRCDCGAELDRRNRTGKCNPCSTRDIGRGNSRAVRDPRAAGLLARGRKWCSTCGADKPLEEFGKEARSADERGYRCRPCERARAQAANERRRSYWKARDPYSEHPTGEKHCGGCSATRPVVQFSRSSGATADGLQSRCKTCQLSGYRIRTYGRDLGPDDVCEVCGGRQRLCIDHDHASGATRGVLCTPCNQALGFMRDDPERLEAAAGYLRRVAA